MDNAMLLLVAILFFWAKSASLLNRWVIPDNLAAEQHARPEFPGRWGRGTWYTTCERFLQGGDENVPAFPGQMGMMPLPPLPKLEVSDAVVEKAADQALVWINREPLLSYEDGDKEEFLEEMREIKPQQTLPWIIMGDFNIIYEARDKSNLNLNRRLKGRVRATINNLELKDIKLQNRRFTWTNEQQNTILCKLDRMMCIAEADIAEPCPHPSLVTAPYY
ncbi:hypothetical protein E2562_005127 [Oryza meyeriana var. granulata]|uniref:Endonuclease/exonuclease/phosphatase domain-containing protein n=1 Tax=Oryza meyeriana var. granulata TaxID=110450 RepID=A0A6G1BTN5_9ORYZ|nr:hypothetical protein E2562_005127 [Oryza meyeriana var. granulata]